MWLPMNPERERIIVNLLWLEHEIWEERELQPWERQPCRLISWWEMLEFSAYSFFWCGDALKDIIADCLVGSIPVPGDSPMFAVQRDIDDLARESALDSLQYIEKGFRRIGLQISADTVAEIAADLRETGQRRNFQWLMDQARNVQLLVHKEIKGKVFFYVPAERVKFFPTNVAPHLFGKAVADAFPTAAQDIDEAGMCLGLDRGAACVFHLMRALEVGLGVLGKVFGVSLEHTNWAPAIEQIEKKIRHMHEDPDWKALPDCRGQQEFYAQAASHFAILKDAWRNYTMHARGFYTAQQVERIFENTKGFLQELAGRLHE